MLSRRKTYLFIVVALFAGGLIGAAVGIYAFIGLTAGSDAPSATISAPTLSLQDKPTAQVTTDVGATAVAQLASQVAALDNKVGSNNEQIATELAQIDSHLNVLLTRQAQVPTVTAQGSVSTSTTTSSPTATTRPTNTFTPTPTSFAQALPSQVLFRIVPEESEARYIVDEVEPPRKGLIGRTNQIAGDIIVDFDNPSNSRIGTIRINLRTLQTDDRMRDGTVRSQILLSARPDYEFTDFAPKEIKGLPAKITLGQAITFQVTGDLPLRGVTHSVTFDVTVTPISKSEVKGLAHTTILRDDYGLLQSPLADHGVSQEIILELEFVARAVAA